MNSPQPPDNSIKLLRELGIPGRTVNPISTNPDVWGLNIAAVLDNFPRHGLKCLAGPWGVMGQGDRLVIFWGPGNQVLQKTVAASEVDTELRMFVEARHIIAGNFNVSYAVTRLGQTAEPSEVMKVFVKLTRPGGKDDNDTPGHSKLVMHIPREILEGGIDQDNVSAGVDITIDPYPNIAPGDVIRLSWGGVFVLSPPLTQDQADGKTPIVIHVDEATIRDAGDSDSTGLAVVFELYDKVDNRSEDWSAAQRVVVSIDTARPNAPLLKEALNNVLDVDKLGDALGTGQVIAVDARFFAEDDTIFLRVKGTPVEGVPIDHELPGKVLGSVPSILEIPIPNALLRRLAKTQMVLSYRIQKDDGSADIHSKGQFISVIGELHRLKPPIAEDASQGALDPDLPRTRIEIPWDASFEAGQAIKLFWLGTLPDLTPHLPDLPLRPITNGDISAGLPLYITVDGVHIKPLEGGTLELYYQLLSDDSVLAKLDHYSALNALRESEHASLLNIGEPRLELPEPRVDGVVDSVLDPDRNGTTLTATWLNTLANDKVTGEWEGSITGLHSDWIELTTITAGNPVPFPISANLIKGNEGGTVQARYFVERAGENTRYSQPLDFSVGVALQLDPPRIQQAEADGKTLLPMNAVEALTAVVPPEGLLLTDLLSVTWAAVAGSHAEASHTTEARLISETDLSIALPVTVLAFNLGKTVSVTFTITRDGKPVTSLPLSLNVGTLPVNVLNSPIIMDADNNGQGPVFNVANLTANATYRMGVWPLIATRQYVWLVLKGTNADGTVYTNQLLKAPGSSVYQGWIDNSYYENAIALAGLKNLKDGSSLTMEFKAALGKSQNESEAVVFPVRTYTVKALVELKPEITKAEDSKNVLIPEAGFTVDTTVKLTGVASKGQKVQIKDGATVKGEATANTTNGEWTLTMTGLSVAAHNFTATALYGSGQVSAARTLTVAVAVRPNIISVEDNVEGGDILNGGITIATNVTLTGTATAGLEVEVFDGNMPLGKVIANGGTWTKNLSGLALGSHSFTAKAHYGDSPSSTARAIRVLTGNEDIVITGYAADGLIYPNTPTGNGYQVFHFVDQLDGSTGIRFSYFTPEYAIGMSTSEVALNLYNGSSHQSFIREDRPNGSIVFRAKYAPSYVLAMTYSRLRPELFDPNDNNIYQRFRIENHAGNQSIHLFHRPRSDA